jgi:hypothetical protein
VFLQYFGTPPQLGAISPFDLGARSCEFVRLPVFSLGF